MDLTTISTLHLAMDFIPLIIIGGAGLIGWGRYQNRIKAVEQDAVNAKADNKKLWREKVSEKSCEKEHLHITSTTKDGQQVILDSLATFRRDMHKQLEASEKRYNKRMDELSENVKGMHQRFDRHLELNGGGKVGK